MVECLMSKLDYEGSLEAENDPPIAGHPNAPLAMPVAAEPMQAPARQIRFPWRLRILKHGQNAPDALHMIGVEGASVVMVMEPPQASVGDSHCPTVTRIAT